jgi:ribosomal protein L37E
LAFFKIEEIPRVTQQCAESCAESIFIFQPKIRRNRKFINHFHCLSVLAQNDSILAIEYSGRTFSDSLECDHPTTTNDKEKAMNQFDENETVEMGCCPRCEMRAFEVLRTHDSCYSCGYSSDLDTAFEGRWQSNAQFMAWAAKTFSYPKPPQSNEPETDKTKRCA